MAKSNLEKYIVRDPRSAAQERHPEVVKPVLERESGFVCGRDFGIGYSPERINPGDKNMPNNLNHARYLIFKDQQAICFQSISLCFYQPAISLGRI